MRYIAETQRMMAENIVKLTEAQQIHQQRIYDVEERQAKIEERQAETDQRFNVLLDEFRYLVRHINEQPEK